VNSGNALALRVFAPIAGTYDRYAALLSFGQDPRWRRFLVERVDASPSDTVLDVACGTGAIALALARRYGCAVVGVDQSAEMLAEGRRRVAAAGLAARVRLEQARAESLPFPDAGFDALTFGYLLRYVDDPAATLAELARVVRPGGRMAALDFGVPPGPAARALWRAYVGIGLPALGRLVSPGWMDVGRVLRESIPSFYERYPLERQLADWEAAGIADVRACRLSLGGGVVVWGTRGR
jgi:demethylmenaquinone methyltransferase / 2-methoxy-6-polyprenyl-1,4-benzoquinol methylase